MDCIKRQIDRTQKDELPRSVGAQYATEEQWRNNSRNNEEMEHQTTLPASWEIYMQVKKQQLELDMEQRTGSKLGNKYIKAVYCHPAYLTNMKSTSWEMLGWMKHKLESRLLGEISVTSDTQMTPLRVESEE